MQYLFEKFLENQSIYNLNIGYWITTIRKISGNIEGEKYLNDKFNNGRPFFNGNPIYNIYYPSLDKAIRIVQDRPEDLGDYYMSERLLSGNEYLETPPELTIILSLTKVNVEKAKKDISSWLSPDD